MAMATDLLSTDPRSRDAFRAGERWAMEAVYTHYLPLVQTIVRHGSGGFRGFFDPVVRDDAVQTIFAKAFEERTRLAYNGIDPYSGFLRGLAHNVCRQLLDKDRRFQRKPEPREPTQVSAEHTLIEDETARILRAFITSLTDPRERTILVRYFHDGASEEGLADALGLTRYRTRKIIKNLQKRMLKYLSTHGITRP
ncbi:MAG: RNA polymerase sigma factor (sigma-70 family) [Myxococcota bacterium]|jgi:RNA polymerase sigma factor (sigma-70 family)